MFIPLACPLLYTPLASLPRSTSWSILSSRVRSLTLMVMGKYCILKKGNDLVNGLIAVSQANGGLDDRVAMAEELVWRRRWSWWEWGASFSFCFSFDEIRRECTWRRGKRQASYLSLGPLGQRLSKKVKKKSLSVNKRTEEINLDR